MRKSTIVGTEQSVTPVKTGVDVCVSKHKADWILAYAAMTKCHYNKLA